jgi:hypothetical protein
LNYLVFSELLLEAANIFRSSRFKIRDDEIGKDDLAAWACIRLDRLQKGYRFVHLMDTKGMATNGIILVKVHMEWA